MSAPKQVVGLPDIVEPMKAEAQRRGLATPRLIDEPDATSPRFVRKGLPRGIVISLRYDDPGWTLIIARPEIPPTHPDVVVICNAFDVPASATRFPFERAGITRSVSSGGRNRNGRWDSDAHIPACTWQTPHGGRCRATYRAGRLSHQGGISTAVKHTDYSTVVIGHGLSERDVRRNIRQAQQDGWTMTWWGLRDA